MIAYALGFEQSDLQWRRPHGPDQVVKHTLVPGLRGIFEAKGGSHGLSSKKTNYGYQMEASWITGWLNEIIRGNRGTKDGMAIADAFRDKKAMLALVSRIDIRRQGSDGISAKFELGFQVYKSPPGHGMERWKGFQ